MGADVSSNTGVEAFGRELSALRCRALGFSALPRNEEVVFRRIKVGEGGTISCANPGRLEASIRARPYASTSCSASQMSASSSSSEISEISSGLDGDSLAAGGGVVTESSATIGPFWAPFGST